MWHFSMQGDVSRFSIGSSAKFYVASINKNYFKALADVPCPSYALPPLLSLPGTWMNQTLTRVAATRQE